MKIEVVFISRSIFSPMGFINTFIRITKGNPGRCSSEVLHLSLKYLFIWCGFSILIYMIESRNQIIDKVSQYLHWLTIPKKEFNNFFSVVRIVLSSYVPTLIPLIILRFPDEISKLRLPTYCVRIHRPTT